MYIIDPFSGKVTHVTNQFQPLSAGITLEQIIESFTEPGKQFEFPIKPIPVSLDKESLQAVYGAAIILTGGAIVTALILRNT